MSSNEIFHSSQEKLPSSQGTVSKEPKKALNAQTQLVFQCKNCLKIIGDSICYLAANTKLRSIVLTGNYNNKIREFYADTIFNYSSSAS
jgi:methylmalonyl-CoA mutase N-terminal domain/subunit